MKTNKNQNYHKNDEQREREAYQAYQLRLEGISFEEIAARFKISISCAFSRVKSAQEMINEIDQTNLVSMRSMEVARLDKIFAGLWQDFKDAIDITDPETGRLLRDGILARNQIRDRMLKVIDQRSKLLGLCDIPITIKREATELLELDLNDDSKENIEALLLAMSEQAVLRSSGEG